MAKSGLRRLILGSVAIFALSGCATISSTGQNKSYVTEGVPYFLPKGMVRVTLTRHPLGAFIVAIEGPIAVADEGYLLHANLRHAALSDDLMEVAVDPKTSLLSKVEVTSTGRAADLIENAAKTFGMLQGASGTAGDLIFSGLYDLDHLTVAKFELNQALRNYYTSRCGHFPNNSDADLKNVKQLFNITDEEYTAELEEQLNSCRILSFRGFGRTDPIDIELIAFEKKIENGREIYKMGDPLNLSAAELSKCAKGICYRPPMPIRIRTSILGIHSDDVFMFPDRSRLSYQSLPSGAFAKQQYTVIMDKGSVTGAKFDLKSEVVGFSTLPIKVISAVIAGPTEALGIKSKRLKAEDQYLKDSEAHIKQLQDSAKACAESPNYCPSTAQKMLKLEVGAPAKQADGDRGAQPSMPGASPTPSPTSSASDGAVDTGDD